MERLAGMPILFPFDGPPAGGTLREVAPGVLWARLPLPVALDHVNIWILEDADGWTVVDCGLETPASIAAWSALEAGPLHGRPIRRLVATHGHPDHIGSARRVVQTHHAPFLTTRIEWENAVRKRGEVAAGTPPEQVAWLVAHGFPVERASRPSGFGKIMLPLLADPPDLDETIRNGQTIRFGQRNWHVIVAGGHAQEHASFYCDEDHILIAGDQILPRITPFIGVDFREPDGNPLRTYLDSLALFADLPDDTLVLPGHGLPFRGLPQRLAQLRLHHDERLASVIAGLDRPAHAFEVAGRLFPKAVGTGHERLALSESIAHLNYLLHAGQITRTHEPDGMWKFLRG